MPKRKKPEAEPDILKSWQQIAAFLGQPVSVAQRWATEGMPVKREARRKICRVLSRGIPGLDANQAGEPAQIATQQINLSTELKGGLSFVRRQSLSRSKKKAA